MSKKDNVILTKEMAIKALKMLAPHLSSDDVKECAAKTGLSVFTINQYLRGEVISTQTAEKIVVHFNKVIKKRQEAFSKTAQLIDA